MRNRSLWPLRARPARWRGPQGEVAGTAAWHPHGTLLALPVRMRAHSIAPSPRGLEPQGTELAELDEALLPSRSTDLRARPAPDELAGPLPSAIQLEPLDELDRLGKGVRYPDSLPETRSEARLETGRAGRPLLAGAWRQLCFFNYAVPPERLEPLLPEGVELDTRNGDAFVSLVALDFLDLRLFSVAVPGHRRFSQVNLRFYVREGDRRGVVFLRELVPKRLLAWSARLVAREPYRVARMRSEVTSTPAQLSVEHYLRRGAKEHWLAVHADPARRRERALESEQFFTERHWSFHRSRLGKLLRFQVQHPVWSTLPVARYELDWDFRALYGEEWEWMSHVAPHSVLLAEGSPIQMQLRPGLPAA